MNNAKVTVVILGVLVVMVGTLIYLNRDKFTSASCDGDHAPEDTQE